MFLKNIFAPAYAGAGFENAPSKAKKQDAMTRDSGTSETDDFGAFNNPSTQQHRVNNGPRRAPQQPRQPQQRPSRPQSPRQAPQGLKSSSIIVAIAAVVVVVLLIVLIAVFVGSAGKDIKLENNAFISYMDSDGIYHVAANGKIVGDYEGEVSLIPSADKSFAYIIESSSDGYTVDITDGKKATRITETPVDKVLATASLVPGLVWLEADNGIYYYCDGKDERITKDYASLVTNPSSDGGSYDYLCYMSADASTVIYAKTDAEKAPQFNLFIYSNNNEIKSQKNLYPLALSDDGSIIYGYGNRANSNGDVTKTLYVIAEDGEPCPITDNFVSVVEINPDGNEIVFTMNVNSVVSTYLYAFNPKRMDDEADPVKIGKGYYSSVIIDPEIARLSTFKKTYFAPVAPMLDVDDNTSTYFVNKKYEVEKVSSFSGKFDPNGKYFFFTNNDNTLQYIDLDDSKYSPNKITDDVVDFAVTQKGNLYWLNDSDRLSYYEVSKDKSTRIRDGVEEISMHMNANKLYFQPTDSVTIFSTEEGSKEKEIKFDSVAINETPIFSDTNFKKTFSAVYDNDNDEWRIYYTSNGRSYKYVAACIDLDGFDLTDILDGVIGGDVLPG